MLSLLSYCLKLSVSLGLVSLFYYVVLRKLTFHNWNRFYLLGYSLLSFLVAFIDVSPVLYHNKWGDKAFVQWIPVLTNSDLPRATPPDPTFTVSNVLGFLLMLGIAIMSLRLLFQLLSFIRLKRKAELISVDGMKFYQVNDSIIPFSFGNSVFLNRNLHSEQELKEIVRHEFVHVKQKHSIDILCGELLCLVNWYNPFAWLLKASIRQNLEFIADNQVLENGVDKREYQYMLLKVIGSNQFSIAQNFNFSSLKKRIAMMNKLKSARLNLVKFLFILPLIAALLLAFRNGRPASPGLRVNAAVFPQDEIVASQQRESRDTVPSKTATKAFKVINKENLPALSDHFEITENRAVIHLKDGTTETYDLKNGAQREKFEEKYGKIINVKVPTTTITSISAINAEGATTVVSPVSVVNSVNAEVATSVTTSVSAVTNGDNSTTIIATPEVGITSEVNVVGVDGVAVNGKEEVLITISKSTSRQQLDEYRKQMKEQNMELKYDEIKYDDNGVLVRLSGTMEAKEVNGRFSGSDFDNIIISMIKNGDRSYFKVNVVVKKNAKPRKEVI